MYTIENITPGPQMNTAARSRMYQFLSYAFMYPDKDFIDPVNEGDFIESLKSIISDLPFALAIDDKSFIKEKPLSELPQDDLEAEFIRIFGGGPGGPPCPLFEGRYAKDRMAVMAELIRFYNHFELSFEEGGTSEADTAKELPDHLITELEFLHYLTFKELIALKENQDPMPYRKALRDFIERHLAKWLPELLKSLGYIWENHEGSLDTNFLSFYRDLIKFAVEFVESDYTYVQTQIE